jgi:hypothetical protein
MIMSDLEFLSVSFGFEGENYYALIRKKEKDNSTQYHVTIMNGELEKLLFGNHIITEVDGMLQPDPTMEDKRLAELKRAITSALYKRLLAEKEKRGGMAVRP